MKYVGQFAVIIAIAFAGELLHEVIPLPIPSSVYGIFILFGLLESKLLKVEQIRETARFFIEIMPILFIAPFVSMIDQWSVMKTIFVPFFVVSIATTILVMVSSGRITQMVIRLERRRKMKADGAGSAALTEGREENENA